MEIVEVNKSNIEIYLNLIQSYEGEFSLITKKKPNEKGLFDLDTIIEGNTKGFILYVDGFPAGIAAIKVKAENSYEVCEFYIAPCYRCKALGRQLAQSIWRRYPGRWEVKQIDGAKCAIFFWRKVISEFTGSNFAEDQYEDQYWGKVTRQQFVCG